MKQKSGHQAGELGRLPKSKRKHLYYLFDISIHLDGEKIELL